MSKLTIGMAVFDDPRGVWEVIQSTRMFHPRMSSALEFIVVDNNPSSELGKSTKSWFERWVPNGKYIPMEDKRGTSPPRDRVFEEAETELVMCVDSHIFLAPDSIARVIRYFEQNPSCGDILSGPIVWDGGNIGATQFDPVWRDQMWGVWGSAWRCGCDYDTSSKVSIRHEEDQTAYYELSGSLDPPKVTHCMGCGRKFPILPWSGHDRVLPEQQMVRMGVHDSDPAFEIPGMGLGAFACRKEAWLGFNPHSRGFGGEELYIHEKFRRAGFKALCLPGFKWIHKFKDGKETTYPLKRWEKVRNYVLEFQELEMPLDPIIQEFIECEPPKLTKEGWEYLLEDPIKHETHPGAPQGPERKSVGRATGLPYPKEVPSLQALYDWTVEAKRDLDEHFSYLSSLANRCQHITEFSKRRETIVVWAAAQPERLVSYNTEGGDPLCLAAAFLAKQSGIDVLNLGLESTMVENIEETDLLFIHSLHTKARLASELKKFGHKVKRWIVLGGITNNGQKGEDGGPGLFAAMSEYQAEYPEWFVSYATKNQYGMCVLSKDPLDRPDVTIHLWPPGFGPGTELTSLLKNELGIEYKANCDCRAKSEQMDVWGVKGCVANRKMILQWLREGQGRWGWKEKLVAANKSVWSGLAFKLKLTDPFPGIVDEAIRRAEEKETK